MPQAQKPMTLDEKLVVALKSIELRNAGKTAEADMMMTQQFPMPPFLAKIARDHLGADFLTKGKWNLAEAEAEFGSNWLGN